MPKPNRIIHAPQVLSALIETVKPYLPLELKGTRIAPESVLQVLAYASVQRTTVEASCTQLAGAPSGNRLREVLLPALPARPVLQQSSSSTRF
jgi:hypothetical protein